MILQSKNIRLKQYILIVNQQLLQMKIKFLKKYNYHFNRFFKKIGSGLNEGSGWIIDSVDIHYLTVVKYRPMKGSSYIKLPSELQHHMKGLINLKNSDNECFRWCYIRHINPQLRKRSSENDKALVHTLDYLNVEFPVKFNDYNKIEKQNNININEFDYGNKQKYPI